MRRIKESARRVMILLFGMSCISMIGCEGCSRSKLTKGNFDRIQVGMTTKEVEDILGASQDTYVEGQSEAGTKSSSLWKDKEGEKAIIVFYEGGKVVRKGKKGL